MLRYNYDKELATGTIMAAGTLAQMIPPSLVLVLLSDQFGVDIGDLFAGALIPGLMLSAAYMLYVLVVAYTRPAPRPRCRARRARSAAGCLPRVTAPLFRRWC